MLLLLLLLMIMLAASVVSDLMYVRECLQAAAVAVPSGVCHIMRHGKGKGCAFVSIEIRKIRY